MLDQHFMVDSKVIRQIVDYSKLSKKDIVLEIGSGPGVLTKELRKKCKVITIEIDPKFPADIHGNALDIEFPKFNKIVSNLPYSICEALFWKLIRYDFDFAVLTVPKSFYKKFTDASKIGLVAWYCFDIEFGFDVERKVFSPVPRTDSCVFKLSPKKNKFRFIFEQYDKKLKNALIEFFCLDGISKNEARVKLIKLNLNEKYLNEKISHLSFDGLRSVMKKLHA